MSKNNDVNQPLQVMSSDSLAVVTQQELDTQISTAKKYRRDITEFDNNVTTILENNPDLAKRCFYAIPRAGTSIEGPSVRLAEIVLSEWGNARYAGRIIDVGERTVTAQAVGHDLEKNVAISIEVSRPIVDSKGRRYSEDMIKTTSMAAISIGIRNAAFKVVPAVFVQKYFNLAKQLAIGSAEGKTLKDKAQAMLNDFKEKFDVEPEQILAKLGVDSIDKINRQTLLRGFGIFTALQDGDITIAQAFGNGDTSTGKADVEQPKQEPGQEAGAPDGGKITAETLKSIQALVKKKKDLQAVLNDELIKYGVTGESQLSLDAGIAVLETLKEAGKK